MNIELLFDRYLQLSAVKRPGYIESLGLPEPNSTQQLELAAGTPLAPLLVCIYNKVSGNASAKASSTFFLVSVFPTCASGPPPTRPSNWYMANNGYRFCSMATKAIMPSTEPQTKWQ